jgi:hypothetical protein
LDFQSAQRFIQVPWRQFGRSARAFYGAAQADFLLDCHEFFSLPDY